MDPDQQGRSKDMALLDASNRLVARLFAGGAQAQRTQLVARAIDAMPAPPAVPIGRQSFVVFDLETTGLHPSSGDRICSIGAVRIEEGRLLDSPSFSTLVNPGRPIPGEATGFHGIDDRMVADAPSVADAIARFAAFCGDAVLVAHNAGFDMACIGWATLDGAPVLARPALCSMALSSWLDPHEADHGLDALAARAGIVIQGRHQALGDAVATAQLALGLLNRAAERGVPSVLQLHASLRMHDRLAEGVARF